MNKLSETALKLIYLTIKKLKKTGTNVRDPDFYVKLAPIRKKRLRYIFLDANYKQ